MSRVTAWTESVGIPVVAMACQGFGATVRMVTKAEGLSSVRLLEYPPPNIAVQSRQEIWEAAARLLDKVVELLTAPVPAAASPVGDKAVPAQVRPDDIVFTGDLDQVNEFFLDNVWSDGLPVRPPTLEAVHAMLRFTDRAPGEVIGVLRPKRLAATVWNVAVNGVVAGCRPDYMPVLLALAEAAADPRFHVENIGTTGGWGIVIILNGPIIKELGFHSGQGLLRPQHRANISVGRFLRLLLMNVAGYRLGETDMGTFGANYFPVLAEAEDASPWEPLSVDRGFAAGTNLVTIQSAGHYSYNFLSEGDAREQMRLLAQEVGRELSGHTLIAMEHFGGRVTPILGLTPLVSGIIAAEGFTKQAAKRYIWERARVRAREFDERLDRHERGMSLKESVRQGKLSALWTESDDPERLVPVLHKPEELQIVVCGAPNRNRSFVMSQMGEHGGDVSKEIKLPPNWVDLLKTRRPGS